MLATRSDFFVRRPLSCVRHSGGARFSAASPFAAICRASPSVSGGRASRLRLSTSKPQAVRRFSSSRSGDPPADAAAAIIEQRPGGVALLAQDPIQARLAYLRLRARPITVQAAPDAARLTEIDTIVSLGAQAPGPGWKVSFHGAGLTVYTRQTGPSASARASVAGGGGLLSEPGSS